MQQRENSPTTVLFLVFFVTSCALAYATLPVKCVLIAVAVLGLTALICLRKRVSRARRRVLICLATALIASSALSAATFDGYAARMHAADGESDTVTLRITDCEYTLSYAACYRAELVDSERLPTGISLLLDTPLTGLENGTLLEGTIVYTALSTRSSGSFDAERYYLPKKLMITAEDDGLYVTGFEKIVSVTAFFRRLNEQLSSKIIAHLRYGAGGMAAGVLLGDRDALADSVLRDFRRLGITHLLVVSGSHFSILVSCAERLMRRLHLKRGLRSMLDLVVVVLLMLLTGMTPSVLRAGILHLLARTATLVARRARPLHSLALAGTIMLFVNPFYAVDCGLQLSFIASYCCLLYQPARAPLVRAMRSRFGFRATHPVVRLCVTVLETVVLNTVITINTLPLMWLYFGEVSLLSVPINLLFIPLVTVLLYLTGIYLLLYPLRIFIFPMAALLNGYCKILESLASFFSSLDGIVLAVNHDFALWFLLPLVGLLVVLPFSSGQIKRRILLGATTLCVAFFTVLGVWNVADRANTYLSYLPDKKNDGFVLKSDGKLLLCEVSDASFSYAARLCDEVSALHCCEIDAVLFTHYHSRHVTLLTRLCEREIVRELLLPEPINEQEVEIYAALCETASLYALPVTTVEEGGTIPFADATITLYPRTYLSRSSHPITAVSVAWEEEMVALASCSFNESDPAVAEALAAAEYPLLGRHSPVYKKAFTLSCDGAKAIIMSEAAREYAEGLREDAVIQPSAVRLRTHRGKTEASIEP